MDEREADIERIRLLIEQWHATRRWAEQLLTEKLRLAHADGVLQPEHRGYHAIPDTEWWYRTHGLGVDVSQPGNRGGIDFDFGTPDPCPHRLREFLVKQLNAGNIEKRSFRPLVQDQARWSAAVEACSWE